MVRIKQNLYENVHSWASKISNTPLCVGRHDGIPIAFIHLWDTKILPQLNQNTTHYTKQRINQQQKMRTKTSPHQSKDSTTFSTYQTTQNHNRMNNVRFIFNFSFHILRLKQTNHFHTLKLPPPQKMRHADTSTTKIYFRNPHHTIFNHSSRIQPSG